MSTHLIAFDRSIAPLLFALTINLSCSRPTTAMADVVVISNRSGQEVAVSVTPVNGKDRASKHAIRSGNVVPIPTRGTVVLSFLRGPKRIDYRLDANDAYQFGIWNGQLDLQKVGLGEHKNVRDDRRPSAAQDLHQVMTLPVKILVDDDQRRGRIAWEPELRRRVRAASDILQKYFRVRLQVIGVELWDSNDRTTDFYQTQSEFAREVEIGAARLAIGFTSQYNTPQPRTRLGVKGGPLRTHLLIAEWKRSFTETERLELLVHELGHHFGAAHSPEADSVMRPSLADGKARQRSFQIGFDVVNTLAVYMITEEMRLHDVKTFSQVSTPTMGRLRQIYAALARSQPDDPLATSYGATVDQILIRRHLEKRRNPDNVNTTTNHPPSVKEPGLDLDNAASATLLPHVQETWEALNCSTATCTPSAHPGWR